MKKILITLFLVILSLAGGIYILFVKAHPVLKEYFLLRTHKILEPRLEPASGISSAPFDHGEKFVFFYRMGILRAGTAELTFVGETIINGKEAYLIRFENQVGTFYDLENIYAERSNFYPIYIERNIKNFGFGSYIIEKYDQKNYEIEIIKQTPLGEKTTVIKKEKPIHNALLLIYYCRRLPLLELRPGYEFDIVLPQDEFKITLRRMEKIKVPAGTFGAYLFESEPEKIKLWIATDERRTPLKMENLTTIGPSSITLEE